MIEFIPFPLLAGLGILVILLILMQRKISPGQLLCFSAFWLYMLTLTGMILFPMPLPGSVTRDSAAVTLSKVNLTPFYYLHFFKYSPSPYLVLHEILGNILVVMPFGFGLPSLAHLKTGVFLWIAIGIGLVFETAQLVFNLLTGISYRSVDITDVLLNALGSLAGYALYLGMSRVYPALFNRLKIL